MDGLKDRGPRSKRGTKWYMLECKVHLISPNLLLMAEPIVEKAADVT